MKESTRKNLVIFLIIIIFSQISAITIASQTKQIIPNNIIELRKYNKNQLLPKPILNEVNDSGQLCFSTYLGGSNLDCCKDIAIGKNGDAYITGYTTSSDLPTINAYDDSYNGGFFGDAFVAKISQDGSSLVFCTYLGGMYSDGATAITIDKDDNVYVTGSTDSFDFPTTSNAYQSTFAGGITDAFVAKFSSNGELLYSTYLGGSTPNQYDGGVDIQVDDSENIYIAGYTSSSDFPTINAFDDTYNMGENPYYDAFITKFSTDGTMLLFSTYLGGTNTDCAYGLKIDTQESVYITGVTWSSDFPLVYPYDDSLSGSMDIFVTHLCSTGESVLYSTYIGGSEDETGFGIALDKKGAIYVTGSTCSVDFPIINAYDSILNDGYSSTYDAYVTKIAPDGATLIFSTYLGGSECEEAFSIAVDNNGCAYITGYTASQDFPTINAYQTQGHWMGEGPEGFITKFSSEGNIVTSSSFFGGSSCEVGFPYYAASLVLDQYKNIYIVGPTTSTDYPTSIGGFDRDYNGECDCFITKLYQPDMQPSILFGRICNYSIIEDVIKLEVVNIHRLIFKPLCKCDHTSKEHIIISKHYFGLIGKKCIIVLCKATIRNNEIIIK